MQKKQRSSRSKATATAVGSSLAYENWRHFENESPSRGIEEARLFTDVRILGEVRGLGPYSFLNPVAQPRIRAANPLITGIVVRSSYHVLPDRGPLSMTDDFKHYHGGDMFDEI